MRGASAAIVLVLTLATAACGSSPTAKNGTAATPPDNTTGTAAVSGRAQMLAAVRVAILADHRLAVRTLWTNSVPNHPVATGGPHLVALARSVAARRQRGVRVKLLRERFRIVSVDLDPSYTSATAVVADPQQVRPYSSDGQPLGRAVSLKERARLRLRRLDKRNRFVVWKVTAIR
jgi:hypothetical protein